MTIKVSRVDGVAIPAAQDRRAIYGGLSAGILASGDGLVAAQGTPNMTVQVAAITGLLVDDGVSFGNGLLCFESDASANVTIAAADATNPRIDLVVAKVTGVEFGGADAFTLEAVTGTPAASPAAPAVPTRCSALAEVRVEAGITTIQANKITDRRTLAGPLAAPRVAQSSKLNKRVHWGVDTGSTDASSYRTITHGAGFTPSVVFAIWAGQSLGGGPEGVMGTDTYGATTFRVRYGNAVSTSLTTAYVCLE